LVVVSARSVEYKPKIGACALERAESSFDFRDALISRTLFPDELKMEPRTAPVFPTTLAETLLALKEQRRSCVLRVSDGILQGELRIEDGIVTRSYYGVLEGDTAIQALLAAGASITYETKHEGPPLAALPMLPPPIAPAPALEESMVVPIVQFTELTPSPALHPDYDYDDFDDDEAVEHDAALVVDAPAPSEPPPPAAEPVRLALREEKRKVAATPPLEPPAKKDDPRLRVLIGSLIGALLLVAIVLGRSSEQQPSKAPIAAVPPQLVVAEKIEPAPQPAPAPPPPPAASAANAGETTHARVLTPATAPETPTGALAPTILVRVLIGTDGLVKQAELLSRREGFAGLEQQALDAARTYRFQPKLEAGQAVDTWLTLPVRFRPTPPLRRVTVKGSDTLGESLVPAWAEALRPAQPQLHVEVETLGSTTGLASLLDGSADMAASSRLIRADELALAEKLSLQLREVFVGYDGIAVIVNPNNIAQALDLDAVARVFAQRVTNWRELGGDDAPIRVIGRPGYSGTQRVFKERVLTRLGPDTAFGASVTTVEKIADVLAEVARDVHAIGYVSFGHVTNQVRSLALAGTLSALPVTPSVATIRDGTYPLTRPLLLYLRPDSGEAAHALADFALADEGQAIVEQHGFARIAPGLALGSTAESSPPTAAHTEVVRIYFDPNSATIAKESLPDLAAAASAVRPGRSVVVIGNADSTGDAAANRAIAQRRADVVAARLRELGSREAIVTAQVASADHPIATNDTNEGRRANRRVDVIVQRAAGHGSL
jgi:phosphate transport system substrate-binding protein